VTISRSCSSEIDEDGEDKREGKDDEEDEEEEEEVTGQNGRMDVGSADASHGLSGMDVMTTFGT